MQRSARASAPAVFAMKSQILSGFAVVIAWSLCVSRRRQQTVALPATCSSCAASKAPRIWSCCPASQWVVASSFGGSGGLYLIRASDRMSTLAYPGATPRERLDAKTYATCPGPPDAAAKAKFLTHGLSIQAGNNSVHRLFVVVHGSRESVEVFEVDARSATPTFTWIGCAVAPDPVGLNSVRGLPDGGFVATNFLARGIDAASREKMMAGEKNGELWEWHTGTGWQKIPGSEAAGANGLEISQ